MPWRRSISKSSTSASVSTAPLACWSTDDVITWLESEKLKECIPYVKANSVVGRDLEDGDEQCLHSLISVAMSGGKRTKFLKALHALDGSLMEKSARIIRNASTASGSTLNGFKRMMRRSSNAPPPPQKDYQKEESFDEDDSFESDEVEEDYIEPSGPPPQPNRQQVAAEEIEENYVAPNQDLNHNNQPNAREMKALPPTPSSTQSMKRGARKPAAKPPESDSDDSAPESYQNVPKLPSQPSRQPPTPPGGRSLSPPPPTPPRQSAGANSAILPPPRKSIGSESHNAKQLPARFSQPPVTSSPLPPPPPRNSDPVAVEEAVYSDGEGEIINSRADDSSDDVMANQVYTEADELEEGEALYEGDEEQQDMYEDLDEVSQPPPTPPAAGGLAGLMAKGLRNQFGKKKQSVTENSAPEVPPPRNFPPAPPNARSRPLPDAPDPDTPAPTAKQEMLNKQGRVLPLMGQKTLKEARSKLKTNAKTVFDQAEAAEAPKSTPFRTTAAEQSMRNRELPPTPQASNPIPGKTGRKFNPETRELPPPPLNTGERQLPLTNKSLPPPPPAERDLPPPPAANDDFPPPPSSIAQKPDWLKELQNKTKKRNSSENSDKGRELPPPPPEAAADEEEDDDDTFYGDVGDVDSPTKYDWFFDVKREDADRALRAEKEGNTNQQPYKLSVFFRSSPWHLHIETRENGSMYALGKFKIGESVFSTVPDLIRHHQQNPVTLVSPNGQKAGGEVRLTSAPRNTSYVFLNNR